MAARYPVILLTTLVLWTGVAVAEQDARSASRSDSLPAINLSPVGMSLRDGQGLPGLRPRLSMTLPNRLATPSLLDSGPSLFNASADDNRSSAFSWSLEAWQLNTASLAHIQCADHSLTAGSFLASDCRFVDQPTPDHAVNLVQVRGEWMPAPGLSFGLGAFRNETNPLPVNAYSAGYALPFDRAGAIDLAGASLVDGLDLNLSFGIRTEQLGDFLVGLQLARYRQRMTLGDGAYGLEALYGQEGTFTDHAHSAQLALGWQLGDFRTDLLGQHRQAPMLLSGGYAPAEFSSFDLEFSWQPRNASLSIGVSNVLDAQPRAEGADAGQTNEAVESVFGRIPYVRYKHDL